MSFSIRYVVLFIMLSALLYSCRAPLKEPNTPYQARIIDFYDSKPTHFSNLEELEQWAADVSFGGYQIYTFEANNGTYLILDLHLTSGIHSSETFIFSQNEQMLILVYYLPYIEGQRKYEQVEQAIKVTEYLFFDEKTRELSIDVKEFATIESNRNRQQK